RAADQAAVLGAVHGAVGGELAGELLAGAGELERHVDEPREARRRRAPARAFGRLGRNRRRAAGGGETPEQDRESERFRRAVRSDAVRSARPAVVASISSCWEQRR